jgi:hypothetical protein
VRGNLPPNVGLVTKPQDFAVPFTFLTQAIWQPRKTPGLTFQVQRTPSLPSMWPEERNCSPGWFAGLTLAQPNPQVLQPRSPKKILGTHCASPLRWPSRYTRHIFLFGLG